MKKKLSAVGNSYGLVIEKPILELLKIDRDTELEMTTDGERLIIEPIRSGKKSLKSSAEKIMKKHDSTFRKLAK
ncbi:MAG: AbrB/MazE/SpoVT family DNA-binding domain-containing protein [Bdellovibrionales bacterium]|nr:AbrB/MazE/SpoVT family DNA-binding domain-containing protein [Bdellovibrionales bacterium]MCB0393188.1 AbrB/MazE/SpoVT family DNA-binding domain-containing protein [Bdellovibrionales bacterium]